MNSKLNSHLFWSAINQTAVVVLRISAELISSFPLLFILMAVVYYNDTTDTLFSGIFIRHDILYQWINLVRQFCGLLDIISFLGVAILSTYRALSNFPEYFFTQNKNRPRFESLIRIVSFIKVCLKIKLCLALFNMKEAIYTCLYNCIIITV